METAKKFEITATTLKWIAVITMLINHTADVFMGLYDYKGFWYWVQVYLTRMSFIIFAFLLSEGMRKSSNKFNYMFRLGLLALISEIPYLLVFNEGYLDMYNNNVMFELFSGAVAIYIIDQMDTKAKQIVIAAVMLFLAYFRGYGIGGLAVILCFYFFREKPVLMYSLVTVILATFFIINYLPFIADYDYNFFKYVTEFFNWNDPSTCNEFAGVLALPLIGLYKGAKGKSRFSSTVFYAFYPVHLLILFILAQIYSLLFM